VLLKKMFLTLYIDGEAAIQQALVNAPFDRLAF
jgi:hypothetical protein